MQKNLMVALLVVLFAGLTTPTLAHRYQRNQSDHPLRLVAYALHPVGLAAEYVVLRPIHWVVSRPHLDVVFGHQSYAKDDPTYFEWTHGDYRPSVAEEVKERERQEREEYLARTRPEAVDTDEATEPTREDFYPPPDTTTETNEVETEVLELE